MNKQMHMASAACEFMTPHGDATNCCQRITCASTLLIDDCAHNIDVALSNGIPAYYFNPYSPES
jgi:hypothetical protein